MAFDVQGIRGDFPILSRKIREVPLVYLDSAATALKPQAVIDVMNEHYRHGSANVHRGVHLLSEQATLAFDATRAKLQKFLGAASATEIIFTAGTTAGINLVAQGLSGSVLKKDDEIIVSQLEHHSNIVPWQLACQRVGARLRVIPMDARGDLDVLAYERLFNAHTKLVAVTHTSNAIGTVVDVEQIIRTARKHNVLTLIDGAQAITHRPVDVAQLGCDFYAFSGHKLFGPTGIGVLYGRKAALEMLEPPTGGGGMIRRVTFDKTTYADLPSRLEPGTPNIAGVIGLGAAVDYVQNLDHAGAYAHVQQVSLYARDQLQAIEGLRVIGDPHQRAPLISFVIDGIHAHDLGTLADQDGVAMRVGHHCAQPVMDFFAVAATARVSFSIYNTHDEVDILCRSLKRAKGVFK